MEKYRIAVCDDDETIRDEVCRMCGSVLQKKKICYDIMPFASAEALEKVLDNHAAEFDVLLLDIQMQGKSGMDLARSLREIGNRISIIFITGSEDYLLEGYSVQPLHYLLKPVSEDQLAKALETDLQLNRKGENIFLKAGNKTIAIQADQIVYIESFNHSITVRFRQKTVSYPVLLSVMQGELSRDPRFYRCHKSFIVNMDYVHEISRNGILLSTGEEIPIGRSYYSAFQFAFVKYLNR